MFERAIGLMILSGIFILFVFLSFLLRKMVYQFFSILVLMILQGVLYLYLNAEFLAAVQVIVYAGAILVMFLFTLFLFPEEERQEKTCWGKELSYFTFIPLAFFLFLLLWGLFRGVPEGYPPVSIIPDFKEINKLLFNEYWIVIYLLAFVLSLPMVALYVFLRRETSHRDN